MSKTIYESKKFKVVRFAGSEDKTKYENTRVCYQIVFSQSTLNQNMVPDHNVSVELTNSAMEELTQALLELQMIKEDSALDFVRTSIPVFEPRSGSRGGIKRHGRKYNRVANNN